MNELVPVADLDRMAAAVAASKLFGIQNKDQALALMLVAQAEGLHPATAARDYHIIQGRPALKADAMLARYLQSGGRVEWHEHTDAKVAATFTHPAGGSLKVDWDMDRAKKAGLTGKDNWSKYPRQMLRARVISEGIRATNPAVSVGIYTPEEVQDFEPAKAARGRQAKNMGDAEVVTDPAQQATPEPTIGHTVPKDRNAPAAAGPTRSETLKDLCKQVYGDNWKLQEAKILDLAKVSNAEEMSYEDYSEAVAMLRRNLEKRKAA